jgi:hypothetical protein
MDGVIATTYGRKQKEAVEAASFCFLERFGG